MSKGSLAVMTVGVAIFLCPSLSLAANLISNPSFTDGATGAPTNWLKGRWGSNTATFTYPVTGSDATPAAQVTLSNYATGDAKWYFPLLPTVEGKQYHFTNNYQSTVTSYVTVEYHRANGTRFYRDIGVLPAGSNFQTFSADFIVPPEAIKFTIFHVIKSNGTLVVDDYFLEEVVPPPDNIIINPSLEQSAGGAVPDNWRTGRWGSNTTTFTYPVAGHSGDKAARVQMTSYTTGDAKWYFDPVAVNAGDTYEFSDFYQSSIKTYVTVQFTHSNGGVSYLDLGAPAAAGAWTEFKMPFTVPAGVTSLTIFHVLKGVGTLTVDDFKLKPTGSDPTKFDQGYVSLNFDDGWLSVYQNAIPILNAKGFKSDQFITTDYLTDNYPGYVKPNQVLEMQSQGHIIGNHTKSHPDLTALTLAQAQAEIEGARSVLINLGVPSTNMSFAYPLGAYNTSIKNLVQNAGHIAGRSSDGGFNDKLTDHYALRRQPMLNTTTFTQVKNYIDTARADKTWVILLFHEIDNSGHQYSITPALFQQIVNYLDQINVTPITVKEGIAKMNP